MFTFTFAECLSNPNNQFTYILDRELWNTVFKNPFHGSKNKEEPIILKEYFDFRNIDLGSPQKKILIPIEKFYLSRMEEKNGAFLSLCEFLIRFQKPYIRCLLEILTYNSPKKRSKFSPLDAFFQSPQYPLINPHKKELIITFDSEDLFISVYYYVFGDKPDLDKIKNRTLAFPFEYFRGFELY